MKLVNDWYSFEQYNSEKSYLGKQVEAKVILSLIMSMKSDKESSLNIVSVFRTDGETS